MGGEDFFEPRFVRGLVFAGEDFYDVALFEAAGEVAHFAVDFDADDVAADFAVEAEGEVEGEGAFGEVDDVAFGGVDEDFVGEEVEAEFFEVDFFAFAEFGGGILEFGNPEEVGGEVLDFSLFVVFGEFLFVVVEAGGEAAFGVFVHFFGADLEFDDFFVGGDDGGVERLVTVLLGFGDVIFNAFVHEGVEGVEQTESEVARGDVGDDDAEGGEVVDFAEVLVVLGEFFVEGVDGFDAAGDFGGDFFFVEEVFDFLFDLFEGFGGLLVVLFDEVFEVFETAGVDVGESEVGEFDAEAPHVEAVGEWGEDFQSFEGDFLLFVGWECGESTSVVEAVGEFDDEDANVVAGGNHEAEEVVFGFGEVGVEFVHVFADFAEFSDAVDEEGDGFAEFGFDVFEREVGILDGVVEDAGDDGVFVHVPFFEDFFDGERVVDVGFAGFAELVFVGRGGDLDGVLNTLGFFSGSRSFGWLVGFLIFGHLWYYDSI